ncbi:MAG: response regulator [Lachnospiraceae bacterium]|nr:response regulator [Lachnospiraceae bacterium]
MSRILIVDDSRTSRKILRGLLEEAGHEVIAEAENGEEGVNKYIELKPDVTTLDITMPVMDGLEALVKIREFDNKAKVIMVTAAGQQNKMVEAIKNGASEFVTKPFEKENILKIIEKM